MNIIEKLGITPGQIFESLENNTFEMAMHDIVDADYEKCANPFYTQWLENMFNETVEALIKICLAVEDFVGVEYKTVDIIEKATGKTWEEIKELAI